MTQQHHILRRTLLPWPIGYLHLPNLTVCAGVVGVALSAKIAYPVDGGRCKVEASEADAVERAWTTYSGRRWNTSKFAH